MIVQRITAKIIFLTGLLVQGVDLVRADQLTAMMLPPATSRSLSKSSLNQLNLSTKGDTTSLSNNIVTKTLDKTNSIASLKAPESLSIPNDVKQIQIQSLKALTINDVEEIVKANSPQLKAMKIKVKQSKLLLIAAISRWYPTINLTANGLPQYFTIESDRNSDFGSDTSGKKWQTSISLEVKWNLIDPGRVPEISAAKAKYEQAKESYLISLREIRLQAISQYFILQRADEGVRIGKESIRASLISLRDAKARFEAGVATRLEVLEAETQLARDKQLLTSRLGDQNISRRTLSRLLNLPQDITPIASSSAKVIGLWKASLQESILAAYNFREELERLRLDISINNSNANSALASSQPTVSLVNTLNLSKYQGQTGINSASSIDMEDYGSSQSNTVGINATWNIFDGGKAKALYRYNKQLAKESEQNFAIERNRIRNEVEESFYNLQTANQDITTTTREVIASRESLRLARLRFQAGVTTQREVVNNQRDLTQAEVRYNNAITTYNISLAELRRRTGIDHIKACKSKSIQEYKPDQSQKLNQDIPIEPFPLLPACETSQKDSIK